MRKTYTMLRDRIRNYSLGARTVLRTTLATGLLCAGCITPTGIIKNPDFRNLRHEPNGSITYKGEEVYIKKKLPWYHEMYPDNVPEWGFTLGLAGLSAILSSGGGDDDGEVIVPVIQDTSGGGSRPSGSGNGGGVVDPGGWVEHK